MSSNQILERFLASIKSDQTRRGAVAYLNAYTKYWKLYEGNSINNTTTNPVYRYDWLLPSNKDRGDDDGVIIDIETIQDRIIQFVSDKKREGLGAKAIQNYTNHLQKFYRVNGVKVWVIDWDLIQSYIPDNVKKTQDREYHADEVIAIEEKLDVRGKVVSGVMRGSGVRRGAEQAVSVGDLFPIQTKNYGKIYKIWVYRGSREMYATACIPEVAKRIDDYFEYRMRFGEYCKLYEKRVDHKHEYYDGNEEVEEVWYKADEAHLDPDAPLIREDFDRNDPFAAKYPRRISDHQISDIIRIAAEAAGVREPNEGTPFKRHKVMLTHGFRKLFKKRCRQAKVDAISLERLLGHKNGNSRDGVTKLMMTYDPEDWTEMQEEFEKAIPNLTITKDAMIQAELEQAQAQLKEVPKIEQLQSQLKEAEESKKRLEELKSKHEILQANTASVLNALMATQMGIKSPEVKIIAWRSDEGQESLFEAAAIARAENEAREKKHQQKHHRQ